MRPTERVALALCMSEDALAIARAGIRARRPELSDAGVTEEMWRILHGDAFLDEVGHHRAFSPR